MQNQNQEIRNQDSANANSANVAGQNREAVDPTEQPHIVRDELSARPVEWGDSVPITDIEKSAEHPDEETLTWGLFLRETLQVILPALLLAVVIHMFLAQATIVYGSSMQPVLREKQRLVVNKLTYRFREPQRNDIVVLDLETVEEMLVKRVIGLPGETMDIRGGSIYVNNEPLQEQLPHALSSQLNTYPHPIQLGANEYYVLGDNRSNSNDSRAFGAVQRSEIVGKIWLRYWPLTEFKLF